MQHHSTRPNFTRREALTVGAALATSAGLGCRRSTEPEPQPTVQSSEVPLRVLLCGSESDVEAITLGWAAVDPQPLDPTLLAVDRSSVTGLLARIAAAAERSDVIIAPVMAVAELHAMSGLTAISDEESQRSEEQGGPFLPALWNGAARFAGKTWSYPLGSPLPALISSEPIDRQSTWADYHRWVASLQGAVAEPLADGWAGSMFLWRAVSSVESSWLFTREGLVPQIDSEPYQQALTQMRQTADLYQGQRRDPQQIWGELTAGTLRGGLGFAYGDQAAEIDLSFEDPPSGELTRVLLDPFTPVAYLSSNCRQTAASKRLMRWLSGGEGSERVRQQIPGMSVTRTGIGTVGSVNEMSRYERWLQQRLDTPNTLPTLLLRAADDYYAELDRQVIRCLEGEVDPGQALGETKAAWSEIARRVGIKKQERAWRQAQGMIA